MEIKNIKKTFLMIFITFNTFNQIQSFTISKCSKNNVKEILLETSSGILSGSCEFIKTDSGQNKILMSSNVYSWLSVPYAEPPLGKNRFKAPIEFYAKERIINATKWPKSCLPSTKNFNEVYYKDFSGFKMWQKNDSFEFSEDCLYLNIFIPSDAYNQNSNPLQKNDIENYPILVFFHDNVFKNGSSALDIYNPSVFVASTNIIVITVNYRSGVFGFLYFENYFPGNQGLLDQNLALRWIQKNANKFGGDPNRITLLGHGAGASFAAYHLFYNNSWNFFQNMILQSGSPLINSLLPKTKEEANAITKKISYSLGCSKDSMNFEATLCLQNIEIEKLLKETLEEASPFNYFFVPVIDGFFLTETPLNYLKKGIFKKCPLITGFTTDEGSFFTGLSGLIKNILNDQSISHSQLISYLDKNFPFYSEKNIKELALNAIIHEYTKIDDEINDDGILNLLAKPSYFSSLNKIIGDFIFKCPTYKFIDLIAKKNDQVFLYLFAHRISSTPWPSWYGATHGDDLPFLFSFPLASKNTDKLISENPWNNQGHRYSANEKKLNEEIIRYWSNFIYNNNPNKGKESKVWPKYSLLNYDSDIGNMTDPSEAGRYIILRSSGSKIGRGYSLEACQFWNSYLPKLLKQSGK